MKDYRNEWVVVSAVATILFLLGTITPIMIFIPIKLRLLIMWIILLVLVISCFSAKYKTISQFRKLEQLLEQQAIEFEHKECGLKLMENKLKKSQENLDKERLQIKKEKQDIDKERALIKEETQDLLSETSHYISKMPTLVADFKARLFDEAASFLRKKKRPAQTTADQIKQILKKEYKEVVVSERSVRYKLELLLSLFPELREYVEDEEGMSALVNYSKFTDLKENYDYSKDYLSDKEYYTMSDVEKNQLALTRYISRQKTKWQIGRDYEMACSYMLRTKGFRVVNYGIEKKLEDLGRDLIATKDNLTYVIQCKYWSKDKVIRENTITQLYGTAIEYEISQEKWLRVSHCEMDNPLETVIEILGDFGSSCEDAMAYVLKKVEAAKKGVKQPQLCLFSDVPGLSKEIEEENKRLLFWQDVHEILNIASRAKIQMKRINKVNYNKVVPVIMTNIELSTMAKRFADKLGIEIWKQEMVDFPRIKCNINNGVKIYHLPFDQQYDTTKIDKKGECYAWDVAEAEQKGFRRAKRFFMNS